MDCNLSGSSVHGISQARIRRIRQNKSEEISWEEVVLEEGNVIIQSSMRGLYLKYPYGQPKQCAKPFPQEGGKASVLGKVTM